MGGRIALCVLLAACRLGFDELAGDDLADDLARESGVGPDAAVAGIVTLDLGDTKDELSDSEFSLAFPDINYPANDHVSVDPTYTSLFWFALPAMRGTVLSATLVVVTSSDSRGNGSVIVKRTASAWAESNVTYLTRPSLDDTPLAELTPLGTNARYEVPVPVAVVQRWFDDPAQNFGLAIVAGTTTDHVHLKSREASVWTHLVVEIRPL